MNFVVPLLCDSQKQPVGLFSATTTEGEIVIVFSNVAKWQRFLDPVSRLLSRNHQYLASVTLEAKSFDAVVRDLAKMYPELLSEASFIPDSTPIVEDIISFFTEQAS